jgi:hypothetical protein
VVQDDARPGDDIGELDLGAPAPPVGTTAGPGEVPPGATAVTARKPGLFGRMLDSAMSGLSRLAALAWNWRTFAYGLVGLIILVWLIGNWALWRVDIFFFSIDLPMPVWFVIFGLIGALVLYLWQSFHPHVEETPESEPEAE